MKPRFTFIYALMAGVAAPLHAQRSGQALDQAATQTQVLVFPDTAGVRVEVQVAGAAAVAGIPVRASITAVDGGTQLWSGEFGHLTVAPDGTGQVMGHVTGRVDRLHPQLWSPQFPRLYRLAIEMPGAKTTVRDTVRFGFRAFETRGGRLLLNGRPIFLRGNAINPPERNLPDSLSENRRFATDYVRYLKSIGVNIIRLTRASQVWLDVCDEQGMMLFQGNYGTPKGGKPTSPPDGPFEKSLRWYKNEVLGPQVNHPSVVIYVLANEQASVDIPYLTQGAQAVEQFLSRAYDSLSTWDRTRLYISNAGYGFGRSGDICDLHRYWGWYYNSILSFYTLRDPNICWRSNKIQPMTLTENTGNYTAPDGRFNLVSDTKQPASQLNWTGHAPDSEQAPRALAYQAWVAGQAIEITRRLRERNPYLAGLSPFTILFRRWAGIDGFRDMSPKPVTVQYARSYQPVLLSWELWTPQVYAGSTISPVVHVVNDAESGESLQGIVLQYALTSQDGTVRASGRQSLADVPYYAASSQRLDIPLPAKLPTGTYTLSGSVLRNGDTLSRNETKIFIAARNFAGVTGVTGALGRRVLVYDPAGATRHALNALGVAHREVRSLTGLDPLHDLLVIGAGAWDGDLTRSTDQLRTFVAAGGRVLCLTQQPDRFDATWLPVSIDLQVEPLDHPFVFPAGRPFRNAMAINPERPDNPVLDGIDRDRLFLWSDFTHWNESRVGFPAVYPVTQGFIVTHPTDMAHTSVLADYGHGLEGIALAEMFDGKGSVLLSGFDIVSRVKLDPVADRMLVNMIRYQASRAAHVAHQLVTSKITWGDYASEHGLVTGVYSGLLVNTVPVVPAELQKKLPLRVTNEGFHFAGAGGGWNSNPSVQYIAQGRRPFGPYHFSLGGSVQLPKEHGAEGEGMFWCRVPSGRKAMITTVSNPASEPLDMEVELNGARQRQRIPALGTAQVTTLLQARDTTTAMSLAIAYRGDRRLVILSTDFR
ncbi:MAG: glycoside hydrolase family 2 TIM barrel-domain containing protein [Gemmatimonadaceae bacterium]